MKGQGTTLANRGRLLSLLAFWCCSVVTAQETNHKPPGVLVDVGGYRMHLLIAGAAKSDPTVVFFHGAGDIALHWNLVLPKVGEFARAVAMDQAGEGWSEHGHGMALNQQVYDARRALSEAGLKPPFIVVGHSLGGILAHLFAARYPSETKGVVLVDATHPDIVLKVYNSKSKQMEWKKMRLTGNKPIPAIDTTGINAPPQTSSFQPQRDFGNSLDKFSKIDQQLFHWIYNERPWTYVKGQGSTYEAEVFQEIYANPKKYHLDNIPVTVITAGNKHIPEGDRNWTTQRLMAHSDSLQRDLLNISKQSRQVFALKSGHQIHLEQPDIIVEELKKMIKEMK